MDFHHCHHLCVHYYHHSTARR